MSDKVTDLAFLSNFTGNDQEKVKKYVSMFLDRAPELLEGMQQGMAEKDYDKLRSNAHSLKPQLGYMGIQSIVPDVQAIENYAGEKKNLEMLPGLVQNVQQTMQQALEELKAFVANN